MTTNSPVGPPTLGMFLGEARKRAGLSQERLASRAGLSTSYVHALETDRRRPSEDALDGIAGALGLSGSELTHVYDLAGLALPETGESVGVTPVMLRAIGAAGFPVGYVDENFNLIEVNDECAELFRGIRAAGNVLRWLFGDPVARRVLVDWGRVADWAVAWWRGVLAVARDNVATVRLLRELAEYPEFAARWQRGDVVYDVADPRMRLRHPDTGELIFLSTWFLTTLDRARPFQLTYLGIPMPNTEDEPVRPAVGPEPRRGVSMAAPTLGKWLRWARERAELSREQLAARAAVSSSYVAQLEVGDKTRPSGEALGALTDALALGPAERRHAFDLAGLPLPDDGSGVVVTRAMWDALHAIACPAAFLDRNWNVLGANDRFEAIYPGIRAAGNSLRWLFAAPQARQVMPDWENDTRETVELWRAMFASARGDVTAAMALLAQLREYPDFHRMWDAAGVRFHGAKPALRMRDPATGEVYRLYAVVRRPVHADPDAPLWYLAQPVPDEF